LGRVLATDQEEIVVDQLFPGNVALVTALPLLVEAAERRLELTLAQRARTILRVDAGGGSMGDLNWALERGYQVHAKYFSSQRACWRTSISTTSGAGVWKPVSKETSKGWGSRSGTRSGSRRSRCWCSWGRWRITSWSGPANGWRRRRRW